MSGLSPPNSLRPFSATTFDNKNMSTRGKEESDSSPFFPSSSKIDDSFDIVFEHSNKNENIQFDETEDKNTTSGGIVFEESKVDFNFEVSKKKSKMSKFAQFNENQSSLEDSSSQVTSFN